MGKDSDLLEAARTGDVDTIEKILSGQRKAKVSLGPFSSLRKGPNPSCQDTSGDTPLHHAALHGHKEAVQSLLRYEASANIPDSQGCYPLHLAAWSGNAEICKILITHGPSIAQLDEQNNEGDTALHCAAQYGHTSVVAVLIEHQADTTIRNKKEERALDLAALYGRLDAVQLLIKTNPSLLEQRVASHSPLHLASRNGHRQVVQTLLDSGFDINLVTDGGSALHEAALFGKPEIVRLLIDSGINPILANTDGQTALQLLDTHTSNTAEETVQAIEEYMERKKLPIPARMSSLKKNKTISPKPARRNSPGSQRQVVRTDVYELVKPVQGSTNGKTSKQDNNENLIDLKTPKDSGDSKNKSEGESSEDDYYDALPAPRPVPKPRTSRKLSDHDKKGMSMYSKVNKDNRENTEHLKHDSVLSTDSSADGPPVPPRLDDSDSIYDVPAQVVKEYTEDLPPPPASCGPPPSTGYIPMGGTIGKDGIHKISSPIKPPRRRNIEPGTKPVISEPKLLPSDPRSEYEFVNVALSEPATTESYYITMTRNGSEYGQLSECTSSNGSTEIPKPPSLEFRKKQLKHGFPLSPTGYEQPPTPDFPPPSPQTAIQGIHEKINPQEKRCSRDIETITEDQFLTSISTRDSSQTSADETSGQEYSPGEEEGKSFVASEADQDSGVSEDLEKTEHTENTNRSQKGFLPDSQDKENVEPNRSKDSETKSTKVVRKDKLPERTPVDEVMEDLNPFLGLIKGSTPGGPRKVVSQIYENVFLRPPARKSSKRKTAPSNYVNYDPLKNKDGATMTTTSIKEDEVFREETITEEDVKGIEEAVENLPGDAGAMDESDEWDQIADILGSFGGGIARESVFIRDFEAQFAKFLAGAGSQKIQSVGDWLDDMGLGHYENTMVANGFDDMDFLGGNIVEEADLIEIGILNKDDRMKILLGCKKLPALKPIGKDTMPESVESWLSSLRLAEYLETFQNNEFTTMERVHKIWVLELDTVLDITTLGHRKRILASLGERPEEQKVEKDVSWNLSPLTEQGPEFVVTDQPTDIDLFKDYTGVKPNYQGQEVTGKVLHGEKLSYREKTSTSSEGTGFTDENITIRPPHLAHTQSPVKKWRHKPETLIKGCCNYTSQYLGSTLVKKLQGIDSTKEAITKMKKSTDNIAKVPVVILSISYKGVKFIDAKSHKVICEHEVSNIFCACQDGDHLNFFAYITKDLQASKHYCHVFSVRSTELATEIILTLGEAFEVAYQVAMKEKASESAEEFEQNLNKGDAPKPIALTSKGV